MPFQSYMYRDNEECFESTLRLEVQLGVLCPWCTGTKFSF